LASTKTWHRFVFWGLGGVMFLLIIVQAQRNAATQKNLEDKIDAIQVSQQHTHIGFEPVPVIAVDNPSLLLKPPLSPFRPGFSAGFNVYYQNVGTAIARGVGTSAMLIMTNSKPDLDQNFLELRTALKPDMRGDDLVPQARKFFTVRSAVLSEQDVQSLTDGKTILFIVAVVRFSDATGRYEQNLCRWLQPPGTSPVWHECAGYNQEIKIRD
jgi:hypothetical protein